MGGPPGGQVAGTRRPGLPWPPSSSIHVWAPLLARLIVGLPLAPGLERPQMSVGAWHFLPRARPREHGCRSGRCRLRLASCWLACPDPLGSSVARDLPLRHVPRRPLRCAAPLRSGLAAAPHVSTEEALSWGRSGPRRHARAPQPAAARPCSLAQAAQASGRAPLLPGALQSDRASGPGLPFPVSVFQGPSPEVVPEAGAPCLVERHARRIWGRLTG